MELIVDNFLVQRDEEMKRERSSLLADLVRALQAL